jgi:hypothetical protein
MCAKKQGDYAPCSFANKTSSTHGSVGGLGGGAGSDGGISQ